jgi:D-xylulose reductase
MGAVMTQPVPLFQLIAKEIRVVGSFRYGPGDFKFAVALVERGVVDLRPLVTQRYSFENALEAFNTTRAGKDLEGNVGWVSFDRAVLRLS